MSVAIGLADKVMTVVRGLRSEGRVDLGARRATWHQMWHET